MLILFGLFFLLLLMGASIAMSMFISSVAFMVVYGLPLELIAQRLAAGVDSFPLLAVAFFVLAGNIMNKGGIAMRLINLAKALTGKIPGAGTFQCIGQRYFCRDERKCNRGYGGTGSN